MAGAFFTLTYEVLEPGQWVAVRAWLDSLAGVRIASTAQEHRFSLGEAAVPRVSRAEGERHAKRTCEYVLSLKDAPFTSKVEREAIRKSLGYVPEKALTGCAMCRDAFNTDGLLLIQEGLVERLGGWFVFEGDRLPDRMAEFQQGTVAVNVADYEGYFGAGPIDPNYAAQYEEFVPRKTIYFVDAKLTGLRHLEA